MINFFEAILQRMFTLPEAWSYFSGIRYYISSCMTFFFFVVFSTVRKIIFIVSIFMIFKPIFIIIIIRSDIIFFFVLKWLRKTGMREHLCFMNLWERSFFLIDSEASVDLIFLDWFWNVHIFWFAKIMKALDILLLKLTRWWKFSTINV